MSKQDITKLVEAFAPTVDGAAPRIYSPERARRGIESADCPARLILPSTEGDEHTFTAGMTGTHMRVVWVIKDLLLYKPVEEGMGWLEVGYSLDDYCDSYIAALASANHDANKFCAAEAELESGSALVGVHTFSERQYYGVMVTLRIIEII